MKRKYNIDDIYKNKELILKNIKPRSVLLKLIQMILEVMLLIISVSLAFLIIGWIIYSVFSLQFIFQIQKEIFFTIMTMIGIPIGWFTLEPKGSDSAILNCLNWHFTDVIVLDGKIYSVVECEKFLEEKNKEVTIIDNLLLYKKIK